ncbi:MAG TPA: hypothetical protein VMD53_18325 [Rhizomicrobium sp.]|nr:hypothetical protein [Rhizomicrobium sp.]
MRAYLMAWEEKESGWGTRPDGWSLHVSPAGYEDYLKRHRAMNDERFERRTPRSPPWEFSQPVPGAPLREVELPDGHALARRLAAEKSLRVGHFEPDRYELERLTGLEWPGL